MPTRLLISAVQIRRNMWVSSRERFSVLRLVCYEIDEIQDKRRGISFPHPVPSRTEPFTVPHAPHIPHSDWDGYIEYILLAFRINKIAIICLILCIVIDISCLSPNVLSEIKFQSSRYTIIRTPEGKGQYGCLYITTYIIFLTYFGSHA